MYFVRASSYVTEMCYFAKIPYHIIPVLCFELGNPGVIILNNQLEGIYVPQVLCW